MCVNSGTEQEFGACGHVSAGALLTIFFFFSLCRFAVTRNETEGEGPSVDGAGETQELLSSQTSEGERSKTKGEHARRLGCVSETLISFCGPPERLGNFQRGLALSGWQNILSFNVRPKTKQTKKENKRKKESVLTAVSCTNVLGFVSMFMSCCIGFQVSWILSH